MDYTIKAVDNSGVNVSRYEDGVWISIQRHCGYASTHLTKEQAVQLRDALVALTQETENVK